MGKHTKIPTPKIETGIILSLQSSRRNNHMAKAVLKDWKPRLTVMIHSLCLSILRKCPDSFFKHIL